MWNRDSVPGQPAPAKFDRSGFANVNGIRLYNAEVGKGSPVLLLHGGLAKADYLARQVDALKAHHRVIAVDTRGHGRSTPPACPAAGVSANVIVYPKIPPADRFPR
ncbi:alpha/beta fold hydrolase [Pandoraea sp. NPDC087047]|uniref:alpha/beta fold hydrolase n=1 Tax=Pandoraea sp. NPDC087047 TaxID=3364390 RepID=UPI0038135B2C